MTDPQPVVCCDLDGVVWRGDVPIPGAAGAVDAMRAAGARVTFLTNNASGRVVDVVDRLAAAGIVADTSDVGTSAQAAAALLARTEPAGTRVYVAGGPGVVDALGERGFVVVDDDSAEAVVVGWHRSFDFDGLRRAADIVRSGARFIATNLDPTYPDGDGLLPGAGSIVAAVATAAGRQPEVAGKPGPAMVELVRERWGSTGIMVGDRPSTDGALADALGWPFGLVLSGVAGSVGEEPVPVPPPPLVAPDLAALAPLVTAMLGRLPTGP